MAHQAVASFGVLSLDWVLEFDLIKSDCHFEPFQIGLFLFVCMLGSGRFSTGLFRIIFLNFGAYEDLYH